ncbi:hypothetical protein H0H87_007055 [Tephrocybe sp. NHM501043]|nr:hypothetical protein H0H87_007055 [Tephrocybe sp. NHM501043]
MLLTIPRPLPRLKFSRAFATSVPRQIGVEDTKKQEKPLYGTAPSHRSYIFLHAAEPPTSFPARLSTPLQRALQLKVMKWGGSVNFSWFGPPKATRQALTAFSAIGGRLEIRDLTLENLDQVERILEKHATQGPLAKGTSDEIHLYVCTHGARDCRCGETGGQVYRALQEETARLVEADPFGVASRIRVGEVGHVGGHQFSALNSFSACIN